MIFLKKRGGANGVRVRGHGDYTVYIVSWVQLEKKSVNVKDLG